MGCYSSEVKRSAASHEEEKHPIYGYWQKRSYTLVSYTG